MCAPSSRGAETQAPEEWIFSVVMPPQWNIADAVFAYQFRGGYYLPAIELAEGFEFFIEAETDRAFISGFAGSEDNTFAIDGERGEMIIKGEREPLPDDAILSSDAVFTEDVYVRMDVLNRIWPVEMEVSLSDITILVEAEEELSFERRIKRERRQTILEARREHAQEQVQLPYRENAYQWFGKPVLDIQSSYEYDMDERELSGTNNISGTQHIAKFIADYNANYRYTNGKIRRPSSIRARFSRQAPNGEDLFIPTLKYVALGDVSLGMRDLISSNASGRGVRISNDSSGRTREFDRITVEGRGPPGWEAELYNNNTLERVGVVEEDGEYRFEDIILNFGNNRIRVILYGPQGQVREEVEEYQIGGGLLSPGEFSYRGGVVDEARSFIQLEDIPSPTDPHVTQTSEFSYGLNRWLTLFGSYTRTPISNEEARYYTGGLAFTTPFGFGEVEGYRRINGGSALDTRFITELLGIRLNMRGAFYSKFESDEAGNNAANNKRFQGELQARTRLNLPFLPMNLVMNLEHQEFNDGRVTTVLDTSQTFTGGGLRFNHNTTSRFVNEVHETSTGGFGINWNQGPWQTRGGLNYSLHPQIELTNGNAEIRYRTREAFQAAMTLQHNFRESLSTVGAQLGYDFGDILSTFDAQYRRERGWQFTVRASTSINPYNPEGMYKLSSRSQQNRAPVLGRIFLDRDNDGTFTEGDEPIKGAKLKVAGGRTQESADENGYLISSLRKDQIDNIEVAPGSLQDPYFSPVVKGYSTTGVRGAMPRFEFPVVETGAIDGIVYREPSGRPVPGMRLQLVTEDGEIYMTTETAFDGYYAFEYVLPGTYIVRADPEYKVNVPAETVTVSSDEIFIFGVDLYLLEPVAEESAAEEADGEGGRVAQNYPAPAVSGTSQPAPVSPQNEGSSLASGEPSDEDRPSAEESSDDQGSSLIGQDDPGGRAASDGITRVRDVRIGEYPDKIRLVLDLSGPASYSVDEGDNGLVVLVDMPGTVWETVPVHDLKYSTVLENYRTETLDGGGTRLVLNAHTAMKVENDKLLPAEEVQPDRLILDLAKK